MLSCNRIWNNVPLTRVSDALKLDLRQPLAPHFLRAMPCERPWCYCLTHGSTRGCCWASAHCFTTMSAGTCHLQTRSCRETHLTAYGVVAVVTCSDVCPCGRCSSAVICGTAATLGGQCSVAHTSALCRRTTNACGRPPRSIAHRRSMRWTRTERRQFQRYDNAGL